MENCKVTFGITGQVVRVIIGTELAVIGSHELFQTYSISPEFGHVGRCTLAFTLEGAVQSLPLFLDSRNSSIRTTKDMEKL